MNLQFFIIIATRHNVRIIILHLYGGLDSKSLLEPDRTETTYKSEIKAKHVLIKTNLMQKSGGETANPFSLPYTKPPAHNYITIIKKNPKPSSWPQIQSQMPCKILNVWAEMPSVKRKSTVENSLGALAFVNVHRVVTQEQQQQPFHPG